MLNMNIQMKNSQNKINASIKNDQGNNNINEIRNSTTNKNPQTKNKTSKDLKSNKRLIGNKISITSKLNNEWLNKYFIYRHASLNNYLFKLDFKKTLDYLAYNYKKQVTAFTEYRSPLRQNINSNKVKQKNNLLNSNLILNNKNIPRKKTFIVTGGYSDVVKNLTERGWVREPNAKSLEFDYIWTLKTCEM